MALWILVGVPAVLALIHLTTTLLAWSYVALRVAHSVIHLTYHKVVHRSAAFAASTVVLIALWIVTAVQVL